MAKDLNQQWHELDYSNADSNLLPKNPAKIKLLADQNIPQEIIEDLSNSFSIKSVFDLKLQGHPDENIREEAKKLKRVLLTTDKDFWDEKKHPIKKCFGIICCEAGPEEIDKITISLARLYVYFAKYYPNEWWNNTKAYIKTEGFTLRILQAGGVLDEDEYLIKNGKVMTRKIR